MQKSKEQIKGIIAAKTGYRANARRLNGSMKDYTRFYLVNCTEPRIEQEKEYFKSLFPTVEKVSGCFIDSYGIDIHNRYINHEEPIRLLSQPVFNPLPAPKK